MIGTYVADANNAYAIINADQFGGAGGTGRYMAVGSETGSGGAILLNLNSDVNYFGFWWSAGDQFNSITFLQNNTALATFTTAQVVALLPRGPGTATAINGTQYSASDYYGNPNSGSNPNEPYAYVDVIATGLQFNQVLISNPGNSGFESDNHSIAAGVTSPPAGDVVVSTLQLTPAASAPEPASCALALLGLGAILFGRRRVVRRT